MQILLVLMIQMKLNMHTYLPTEACDDQIYNPRIQYFPIGAQLLETALLWLRADVFGDFAEIERLIAKDDVAMYGTVGREEALQFKRNCLPKVSTEIG